MAQMSARIPSTCSTPGSRTDRESLLPHAAVIPAQRARGPAHRNSAPTPTGEATTGTILRLLLEGFRDEAWKTELAEIEQRRKDLKAFIASADDDPPLPALHP